MSSTLLRLYHRLPLPARSAAASARGWYLRTWRYGADTDQLVHEALERERWSTEQWRHWREERLAQVLHRAATRVPYYRDQWAARRKRGDRASWEVLGNWPVLEKGVVRRASAAFVADDCRTGAMFHEHTSGSTGTSLDLWWSRATVRAWYALFEARWRRWYGVSRHDRWAILGGQLVTPSTQRRPPFWVWNPALHQLYMSSYHLAPDLVPHYVDAMRRYRVRYVFGYTSALHALVAAAGADIGRELGLEVAITNAEPVLAHQREAIERAFGCPVRETYGMAEIVTAAGECSAGRLHLWPEVGVVELLNDDVAVAPGGVGELICTSLLNIDMPLIRYRVGDRAALDPVLGPCACGCALPRVASIDGRIDDALYTRDGRIVGRLDPVFKSQVPIHEAQIIQESLDRVRVRFAPDRGFSPRDGEMLVMRIRERLGDVAVELEQVDAIPRLANGKLRSVICALSSQDREFLRRMRQGSR